LATLETIRQLTVRLRQEGVREGEDALRRLAAAQAEVGRSGQAVAVATEKAERSIQSAAKAAAALERRYVDGVRARQELERVERTLQRAVEAGAKTQAEASVIYQAAQARLMATVPAARAVGQQTGAAAYQVQNLRFQLNDIATGLASGGSPFTILSQQAGQISQVLGEAGGLRGAVGLLGQAFMSMLNPVNAVIAVLGLATVAASSFFGDSEEGADAANQALEKQKQLIDDIKRAYGEAAVSLEEFRQRSLAALQFEAERGAANLPERARTGIGDLLGAFPGFRSSPAFDPFRADFNRLLEESRRSVEDGTTPDIPRFLEAIRTTALNSADEDVKALAEQILRRASELELLAEDIRRRRGAEMLTRISPDSLQMRGTFTPGAMEYLNDRYSLMAQGVDPGIVDPNAPIPAPNPHRDLTADADKAAKTAEKAVSDYQRMREAAQQRITMLNAEREALGMTDEAAIKYLKTLELMAQAGNPTDPEQIAEIERLADAWAKAQTQLDAARKAQQELKKQQEEAERANKALGDSLVNVFEGIVQGGDAAKRAIIELVKQLALAALFGEGPLAALFKPGGVFGGGATGGGAASAAQTAASAVASGIGSDARFPVRSAASAVAAADNDNGANLLSFLPSGKSASHVTGLSDPFENALSRMLADAPASIRNDVTINSGFRSVERQRQLFDAAVAKYGSVEAARKWVAPPGRSQHNMGNAADLGFQSPAAREWFHQNAGQYGLEFPMSYEPWHIQGKKGLGDGGAADAVQRLAEASDKASTNIGDFGKSIDEVITGTSLTGDGQGGGGIGNILGGGNTAPAQQAANQVQQVQTGFLGQLGQGLQSIIQGVAQVGQGFLGGFGNVLQSIVSSLGSAGGGGGGGLLGILGSVIGGVFGGGGGGSGGSVPIPTPNPMGRFAEGGISDRPAIFGEAGIEAAVPLSRGRYIPVEMKGPRGGGGMIRGGDVHITVAGDVSERNLEIIRREVERGQKQTLAAVNRAQAGQWRTG
jgi:hypothetical protein